MVNTFTVKYLNVLAIPAALLAISACSSGSDDDDLPTEIINDDSARSVAIQSMELVDSLEYFLGTATALMLNNDDAPITCAGAGTVVRSGDDPLQRFEFGECDLEDGTNVQLTGTVEFDGTYDNGFSGTQTFTNLRALSNARKVSIDGTATSLVTGANKQATELELVIIAGATQSTLTESTFSLTEAASEQQSVQMNLTADVPASRLVAASISTTGLGGQSAACPQSGNLSVTAQDDTSLAITGNAGGNIMFTAGELSDTLACSEIANIDQTIVPVPLIPPEVPGSL